MTSKRRRETAEVLSGDRASSEFLLARAKGNFQRTKCRFDPFPQSLCRRLSKYTTIDAIYNAKFRLRMEHKRRVLMPHGYMGSGQDTLVREKSLPSTRYSADAT